MLPFWAFAEKLETLCYDRRDDPDEQHDLTGTMAETELTELLRVALDELEAPTDQRERLGLT